MISVSAVRARESGWNSHNFVVVPVLAPPPKQNTTSTTTNKQIIKKAATGRSVIGGADWLNMADLESNMGPSSCGGNFEYKL